MALPALPAFIAVLLAAGAGGDLVAAAAASGRPRECLPTAAVSNPEAGVEATSIWRLAQRPELRRYCHLIARAHARIHDDAAGAAKAAREADALLPNMAAPQVVLARAALAAGRTEEALAAFDRALARDPHSVEQPLALHDLARARRAAGKLDEALATYRVLVPRASLLPTRTRRAEALLEAAHTAMAVAAQAGSQRTKNLEEALAYLREAARDPHHGLRLDVALSLVLVLDRAGHTQQADAVLNEQRAAAWATRAPPRYVAVPADAHALEALARERQDPARAAEAWRRYLEGSPAFAEAARARLERLSPPSSKKTRRRR